MKVLKLLVHAWKDLVPYNPSISIFKSKWFLQDEFVDLLTAAPKSQTKVWKASVKVSKDSAPYDPSVSTFTRK